MITKKEIRNVLDSAARRAIKEGIPVAEYQVESLLVWLEFDNLETLEKSAATRKGLAQRAHAPARGVALKFWNSRGRWPTSGEFEHALARHGIESPPKRTAQRILRELKASQK